MLDVVQLDEPLCEHLAIHRLLLLQLLQLPGNLPLLDVHNLLILLGEEELLSLLPMEVLLPASQLRLDLLEFLKFGLFHLESLLLAILNDPLDVPLPLVELMADLVPPWLLDLVKLVEFKFVIRVVVVMLLLELILSSLDLLAHQQQL